MQGEYADRVVETTATTGTGTLTLAGATAGYQSFATAFPATSSSVYYEVYDSSGNWETGYGLYTLSGTTLTRPAVNVLSGSAGAGANATLVGTSTVFCTFPAVNIADKGLSVALHMHTVRR